MKEYTLNIGGIDHTVTLDDEDAKRLGAVESQTEKSAKKATASNKARTASNKAE